MLGAGPILVYDGKIYKDYAVESYPAIWMDEDSKIHDGIFILKK